MSDRRGIFFDMHGVLMDERTLFPQYAQAWAQLMAARFGEGADTWLATYGQMMVEWQRIEQSLNLRAPDGVAHLEKAWRGAAEKGLEQAGVKSSAENLAWMVEELPWEAGTACRAAFRFGRCESSSRISFRCR